MHLHLVDDARPHAAARQLTHNSSLREKTFEHLFLSQLGLELLARGVDFDVLHGEVDRHGYDVVIDAGGVMRHIQLKVTNVGGARSDVSVNTKLSKKPSGCVVWLIFDPKARSFGGIRWFGSHPGHPLPDTGMKIARHSRANADGVKEERPDHRVLPGSRFDRLEDIGHLADRLFGIMPDSQQAFLWSRLHADGPLEFSWMQELLDGDTRAIPEDVSWDNGGAALGRLLPGYRMLELISDEQPDTFLERQREGWRAAGAWPGDAITLWTTLFLETRADHVGANDTPTGVPHLDQLCRQLRSALIELANTDA